MNIPVGQYIDLGWSTWDRSNAGYEWHTDEGVVRLIEKAETTNYVCYEPLSIPTLFLQFAELNPDDSNSLLQFANKYGPLCIPASVTPVMSSPPGETLEFWQTELIGIKNLVNLWQWQKTNNLAMLNQVITWERSQGESPPAVWYAFNDEEPQLVTEHPSILSRFKPGDVLFPALHLIANTVMGKLRDWPVDPFLFVTPQGELVQRFVPKTLLAAIWFQVFQAVSGEKRFKRCDVCQLWEDVTDKKATWRRHTECATRERMRKFRSKSG